MDVGRPGDFSRNSGKCGLFAMNVGGRQLDDIRREPWRCVPAQHQIDQIHHVTPVIGSAVGLLVRVLVPSVVLPSVFLTVSTVPDRDDS